MNCKGCRIIDMCVYSVYSSKYSLKCPCTACLIKAICVTHLECNFREDWKYKLLNGDER